MYWTSSDDARGRRLRVSIRPFCRYLLCLSLNCSIRDDAGMKQFYRELWWSARGTSLHMTIWHKGMCLMLAWEIPYAGRGRRAVVALRYIIISELSNTEVGWSSSMLAHQVRWLLLLQQVFAGIITGKGSDCWKRSDFISAWALGIPWTIVQHFNKMKHQ